MLFADRNSQSPSRCLFRSHLSLPSCRREQQVQLVLSRQPVLVVQLHRLARLNHPAGSTYSNEFVMR